MTSKSDRLSRIEKLAGEAEKIGKMRVGASKIIMWAEDNGTELSTLLHDLAKRIKAEDGGGL